MEKTPLAFQAYKIHNDGWSSSSMAHCGGCKCCAKSLQMISQMGDSKGKESEKTDYYFFSQ